MPTYHHRPYVDADLPALARWLSDRGADGVWQGLPHVGDLTWGFFQNEVFDPAANVQLWFAADQTLVGWAWFSPPTMLDLMVDPANPDRDRLRDAMLAWGEQRASSTGSTEPALTVAPLEVETEVVAALWRRGYAPGQPYLGLFRFELDQPIPLAPLPTGASVRAVADVAEWPARVDLHRVVWAPSKVTVPAYRRLRAQAAYDPDLDLVAVAPDGALAAYCIVWFDPLTGVGEFEPVGTHPDWRRQGYGRAVLREGLRRLLARGAQTALVYSGLNDAALGLYRSAGFTRVGQRVRWTRSLTALVAG